MIFKNCYIKITPQHPASTVTIEVWGQRDGYGLAVIDEIVINSEALLINSPIRANLGDIMIGVEDNDDD